MSGRYLTIEQLRLPGDVARRATTEEKTAAIEAASREADSYLRSAGYDTPLSSELAADAALRRQLIALVACDLAITLGLLPEPAEKSALFLDRREAREVAPGPRQRESLTHPAGGSTDRLPLAFQPRGWEQ